MSDRRRFQVVPPDWGQDHLTLEAVVAYVDGELAAGPHDRAVRHLDTCPECANEVTAQRRARSALRGADAPTLPPSLLSALHSIPQDTELPGLPAGLALTGSGELVAVLRPEGVPQRGSRRSRRVKLGTGAAVSGLALGALAFGLPAATGSGPAAPGAPGPASATPAVARLSVNPVQPGRARPGAAPSSNAVAPGSTVAGATTGAPPAGGTGSGTASDAPFVPGSGAVRDAGLPPR
ncbi:anti-sigma factor family protein [Pseudonocardia phyllosphaerae]|uniref:anti-sigma factor family protein n=1 Tax=Pseudonocardia phyllosphaerae TaxID=3390502 RepID=UPI00397DEEAF